jgi:uncharacterized protein (DUF2147 family)
MGDARDRIARGNMSSPKTQSSRAWLLALAALSTLSAGTLATRSAFADKSAPTSAADKIVLGYWKHIDDDTGKTQSIFKLFEYEGKVVGKIIKIFPKAGEKPQTVCSECAGRQKDKPVVGLIFFWDFVVDKENGRKWVDGKILNPSDGKTYNAEAELSADGKKLSVYGYIRILVKVGGTSVWQRPSADELQGI